MAKACEKEIFVLLAVETFGKWTPFAIKLLWAISVSSCCKMLIVKETSLLSLNNSF